jgi:multicomponent Na+:H+ antiporter subunit E
MSGLLFNMILAAAWAALTGDFSLNNLLLGFGIGFLVLLFSQRIVGTPDYARRAWRIADLFLFLLYEIITSNLRVTLDVLNPRLTMRPGVIAVPLDLASEVEVMLLVNLVMLTPGTLALDISSDRSELFLHTMHADDPDKVRSQIKQGFERRIRRVLR